MEYVREQRFSVYLDTNKRTVEKSFDSLSELLEYVHELSEGNETLAGLLPDLPPDGIRR